MDNKSKWLEEFLNDEPSVANIENSHNSLNSQANTTTSTWESLLAEVKRNEHAERERLVQSCINLAEQLGFPKLQWRSGHYTPIGQANWRYFLVSKPLASLKHELFPLLVKQVYELIDQET